MSSVRQSVPTSKPMLWTGRIMSGLAAAFMLFDGTAKLFKPSFVVEPTTRLGYPESVIVGLGTVLIVCTLLYVYPRTAVLGAILLTGYLGGAVASQVRIQEAWFSTLFPVVFAGLVWGGLVLCDARLRSVLPWSA
jgi:hypothetical protein